MIEKLQAFGLQRSAAGELARMLEKGPVTPAQALKIPSLGMKSLQALQRAGILDAPPPGEFEGLSVKTLSTLINQGIGTREEAREAVFERRLWPGVTPRYGALSHGELCAWLGIENAFEARPRQITARVSPAAWQRWKALGERANRIIEDALMRDAD